MITKKTIDAIYKKYKKRPVSPDDLNIAILFESASPEHAIEIIDDNVVINSVDPHSPFHRLPLEAINAIIDFDAHVAIVMHSSILFLNKDNEGVSVHIKPVKPTFASRMHRFFGLVNHKAIACL